MTDPRPPRWARVAAKLLIRGPQREFVLGDLEELFTRQGGGLPATAAYLRLAVHSAQVDVCDSAFRGVMTDVRVALRRLRKEPRVYFGSSAVLTVGLGVATLAWGVHYGASERSLPVSDPTRVVGLGVADATTHEREGVTVEQARTIRASVQSLEAVGLWAMSRVNLSDEQGTPQEVTVNFASVDLFRVLEISPFRGRTFLPEDETPSGPRVALIGYRFWRERYGADPGIVGRSVRLDGESTLIVGVLPPDKGLTGLEAYWLPTLASGDATDRVYRALGLLRRGRTLASVRTEIQALSSGLAADGATEWKDRAVVALTPSEVFYGTGPRSVSERVLSLGGLLLAIMALANVTNLFLVRARLRSQELSVRLALGAGKLRVLRQLALEAAIPALLGFIGACLVAARTLGWYQSAFDGYASRFLWQVYSLELPHVTLIASGAVLSTVLVSVVAGSWGLRDDGQGALRHGRGIVSTRFRLGGVLLAIEVAVGTSLMLVASLMIRSAVNLRTIDYGFATSSVLTGDIALRGREFSDPARRVVFWSDLQTALTQVNGVEVATVGTQLPMIRCCGSSLRVELEVWDGIEPSELPLHYVDAVAPTYLDAFGRGPTSGRGITSADGPDSEPVAMVNEPFAAKYFPRDVPVGRRVRVWRGDEPGPWRTIVGIAPHLWMDSDENARPEGLYVPLAQFAPARASVAIRVQGPAGPYAEALRAAVARLDGELPVTSVRSMSRLIHDQTSLYRLKGPLFILLGVAALLLAVSGLYTVVCYLASLRTAELSMRAALGASRQDLMGRSVMGAALPTLIGSVTGLAVGLSLTLGFERFVFLVNPWNPWAAGATLSLILGLAIGASSLPALRASRVDIRTVLEAR